MFLHLWFAYPSRFQSHSVYPVETMAPPSNGGEGNRTPVQNVDDATYSTKVESPQSDLNQRPTLYKSVALPLSYVGRKQDATHLKHPDTNNID